MVSMILYLESNSNFRRRLHLLNKLFVCLVGLSVVFNFTFFSVEVCLLDCKPNEHCVKVDGNFQCVCRDGFEQVGDNCQGRPV